MAAKKPGVDTLAKVGKVIEDWRERIMAERLSDTGKAMVDIIAVVASAPCPRDGWLRQMDHIRQWFNAFPVHDKAAADKMLPALMKKLEGLNEARTEFDGLQ